MKRLIAISVYGFLFVALNSVYAEPLLFPSSSADTPSEVSAEGNQYQDEIEPNGSLDIEGEMDYLGMPPEQPLTPTLSPDSELINKLFKQLNGLHEFFSTPEFARGRIKTLYELKRQLDEKKDVSKFSQVVKSYLEQTASFSDASLVYWKHSKSAREEGLGLEEKLKSHIQHLTAEDKPGGSTLQTTIGEFKESAALILKIHVVKDTDKQNELAEKMEVYLTKLRTLQESIFDIKINIEKVDELRRDCTVAMFPIKNEVSKVAKKPLLEGDSLSVVKSLKVTSLSESFADTFPIKALLFSLRVRAETSTDLLAWQIEEIFIQIKGADSNQLKMYDDKLKILLPVIEKLAAGLELSKEDSLVINSVTSFLKPVYEMRKYKFFDNPFLF